MRTYQTIFGTASGIIAFASYIPYVISIVRNQTKPSRATFGIWAGIGSVEVVSYIAAGARTTIWLPLVYAVGAIVVFVLSIRHGVGGAQKLDILCVIGALLGVIGWVATSNPQVALYCSVFAASCGFLPTIRKVYRSPETESRISWVMASLAGICNVLAISSLAFHIALYPLSLCALDTTIAVLVLFPSSRRIKMIPVADEIQ